MVTQQELLRGGGIQSQLQRQRQQQQILSQRQMQQQQQQQQQVSKAQEVLQNIQAGRITDPSQIPSEVRQLIDLPPDYFQKQSEQKAIQQRITRQLESYDSGEVIRADQGFARSLSPAGREAYLNTLKGIEQQTSASAELMSRLSQPTQVFVDELGQPMSISPSYTPNLTDELGQPMSISPSYIPNLTGVERLKSIFGTPESAKLTGDIRFKAPPQVKPGIIQRIKEGLVNLATTTVPAYTIPTRSTMVSPGGYDPMYRPEQKIQMKPLETVREIVPEFTHKVFEGWRRIGRTPGMVYGKYYPEGGIRQEIPGYTTPTRSTMVSPGGYDPFYKEETTIKSFTPEGVTKAGEFVGGTIPYLGLSPLGITGSAILGASLVTAPKTADIPDEARVEGLLLTLPFFGRQVSKVVRIPLKPITNLFKPYLETETITLTKAFDPIRLISKPTKTGTVTDIFGRLYQKETRDVLSATSFTITGEKKIMSTGFRDWLGKVSKGKLGKPFTYKESLKILTDRGFKESQARATLRSIRPGFGISYVKGTGESLIPEEGKIITSFLGIQDTAFIKAKGIPGLIMRGGKIKTSGLKGLGFELGEAGDISLTGLKSSRTKLVRGQLKTEPFEELVFSKKTGQVDFEKEVPFFGKGLESYKETGFFRKTKPLGRKLKPSEIQDVLIGKGPADVRVDVDAPFKISKDYNTGTILGIKQRPGSEKTIEKQLSALAKPTIPKQPKTPKTADLIPTTKDSQEFAPLMVGGRGKTLTSVAVGSRIFGGASTEEITFIPGSSERLGIMSPVLIVPSSLVRDSVIPSVTTRVTPRQPFDIKLRVGSPTLEKPRDFVSLLSIPKIKEDIFTRQIQPPIQGPRLTSIPIGGITPRQRIPTPVIPKFKPPIPIPRVPLPRPPTVPVITKMPDDFGFKRTKRIKGKKDLFVPEIRRYGKWIQISTPSPLTKALGKGKKKVKETLGATLRIRKASTGELVPLRPTQEFRLGKRDPFALVQRREARLGSRQERLEIIKSRRKLKWI